ncbi:MAG: hypothetical protein ACXIUZ_02125 [Lysobacteraceae bacterium]
MSTPFASKHAALLQSLHALGKGLGGIESSLVLAATLLHIAEAEARGEPMEVSQLTPLTGLSSAACSRNVGLLAEFGNNSRAGLKLIEVTPDLADRRKKRMKLTAKGKKLLASL